MHFFAPFGIILGHVVCCDGILMEPTKIMIIVDLLPPSIVKQLINTLGYMRYYRKFIKGYAEMTTPMENLLKKDVNFQWSNKCQETLDILKNKMVTTPILVFPD